MVCHVRLQGLCELSAMKLAATSLSLVTKPGGHRACGTRHTTKDPKPSAASPDKPQKATTRLPVQDAWIPGHSARRNRAPTPSEILCF